MNFLIQLRLKEKEKKKVRKCDIYMSRRLLIKGEYWCHPTSPDGTRMEEIREKRTIEKRAQSKDVLMLLLCVL